MDVVAAVIKKNDQYLIVQRNKHKHLGLKWEFPGGKINPGENAQAALLRELEEELRISPEPKEKIALIDYDYDDRSVSLQLWNCGSIEPMSITLVEHDSARWLSRDELLQVKWLPADLPIIEKWCQEGLPGPSPLR